MKLLFIISLFAVITACSTNEQQKLPYLGNPELSENDTIYPTIRNFSFIDQDSNLITNKTFENKIYIADFIFLSCPTICPIMTNQMIKVYNVYKTNPNVYFLSHTIDPDKDTIQALKNYTSALELDTRKWMFVTGKKEDIYSIAEENYFTTAYSDSTAPGGFIHGGGLLLIDKDRHIRGVYDGTNQEETKRLINDIDILLKEQF
ncbi:MAG: SCO family protein [Crocinitomicaceae bacterium]|nr:SCO family protein [Crocinitomicaceae bacterium]